jgi:hypothetical protein
LNTRAISTSGTTSFSASTLGSSGLQNPEIAQGITDAGSGETDEVTGSKVEVGAITGLAWPRIASRTAAAARSTQKGTTRKFLVLTISSI